MIASHRSAMSRGLIIIGLAIAAVGSLWPWITRLGLGRLAGDADRRRQARSVIEPASGGRADVGLFFTLHAKIDGVSVAPAWLEGREVIAVFEDRADLKPNYILWLEWRDGRTSFIRDYRYVRYVTADSELTLAPEAKPAGDGAAQ